MAEPIELVSGIAALATFASQSSMTLYKTVQSFQFHPKRVRDLTEELESFNKVLRRLEETVGVATDLDLSALELPLWRCGNACTDFDEVIARCAARSSASRISFRDWSKLRYMDEDIDGFRRLLAAYKLTVTVAVTGANLHKPSVNSESLEGYKDLIQITSSDLEDHLESINEKLESILEKNVERFSTDETEHRLMEEERMSIHKCLQICAQLSERIYQIQHVQMGDDGALSKYNDSEDVPKRVTNKSSHERAISVEKRMGFDEIAWDKSDLAFAAWKEKLFKEEALQEIGAMIIKHRGGPADELFSPQKGAFNVILRMKFLDGGSAIIRFPGPGYSVFPEEKVRMEVSMMGFIEQRTSIRVPHVLYYGMTEESPAGLGPFIIMEYIEHDSDLVDALNSPGLSDDDRPILDPDITDERLRSVYSQMADILLQLGRHSFNKIGCISCNEGEDDDQWLVRDRPLTINMNELVQLGGFPPHLLPQGTFKTASAYFLALAEQHMAHLFSQRNNAIGSEEDCKRKYIARCLFRKLARENRLCRYVNGPFKLFCDDLRPANILASSQYAYSVVGAIDWEFSYTAPAEFTYSPPSWLLPERPEYWEQGLDDWTRVYRQRLPIFLEELRLKEDAAIQRGIIFEEDRLSRHMEESWKTGDFWVTYAARRSWAFDMIYWAKIDRRFFGTGDLTDRLGLLSSDERREMDGFVQKKMAEKGCF
ncbi:uncharacterized protein N7498_008098 [Penicillium cinerascens]|uniref:Azaphilone pigments biosynthesis cluster protein L N-terminal domain-containing protein n=1 Tax=Penicillium cinerascens TaxID=70096 RepID=A0A9W9JD11_9EURO|nr:uncharacterized protein N7498_008098 [Penicillium cinerascens]KAJ5194660.1 hypothetical protein N7498_008098 [Penicillium cinerascens]